MPDDDFKRPEPFTGPIGGPDFDKWYGERAKLLDLRPDPDDPKSFYDYRQAYIKGAEPDETGHWPSDFKKKGHPNEYVGGFSTITGKRDRNRRRVDEDELVKLGWSPATAAKLARSKEPSPSLKSVLTQLLRRK